MREERAGVSLPLAGELHHPPTHWLSLQTAPGPHRVGVLFPQEPGASDTLLCLGRTSRMLWEHLGCEAVCQGICPGDRGGQLCDPELGWEAMASECPRRLGGGWQFGLVPGTSCPLHLEVSCSPGIPRKHRAERVFRLAEVTGE